MIRTKICFDVRGHQGQNEPVEICRACLDLLQQRVTVLTATVSALGLRVEVIERLTMPLAIEEQCRLDREADEREEQNRREMLDGEPK